MEQLTLRFNCDTLQIGYDERGRALFGSYYRQLDERIKTTQENIWLNEMAEETMLELYRERKESSLTRFGACRITADKGV